MCQFRYIEQHCNPNRINIIYDTLQLVRIVYSITTGIMTQSTSTEEVYLFKRDEAEEKLLVKFREDGSAVLT
jgi:hypothetical protein